MFYYSCYQKNLGKKELKSLFNTERLKTYITCVCWTWPSLLNQAPLFRSLPFDELCSIFKLRTSFFEQLGWSISSTYFITFSVKGIQDFDSTVVFRFKRVQFSLGNIWNSLKDYNLLKSKNYCITICSFCYYYGL